jgi:hypothetical protein
VSNSDRMHVRTHSFRHSSVLHHKQLSQLESTYKAACERVKAKVDMFHSRQRTSVRRMGTKEDNELQAANAEVSRARAQIDALKREGELNGLMDPTEIDDLVLRRWDNSQQQIAPVCYKLEPYTSAAISIWTPHSGGKATFDDNGKLRVSYRYHRYSIASGLLVPGLFHDDEGHVQTNPMGVFGLYDPVSEHAHTKVEERIQRQPDSA